MSTSETTTGSAPIDVELRVGQFVKLRDLKKSLEEKHKEELRPVNEALDALKVVLSQALQQNNVDSMKTASGTVSTSTKVSASLADPAVFWAYVVTAGDFDMVDKKPNVTAVTEYVKGHGVPPPGVNYNVFKDVGVRRKS
jgi:hypothetical protein